MATPKPFEFSTDLPIDVCLARINKGIDFGKYAKFILDLEQQVEITQHEQHYEFVIILIHLISAVYVTGTISTDAYGKTFIEGTIEIRNPWKKILLAFYGFMGVCLFYALVFHATEQQIPFLIGSIFFILLALRYLNKNYTQNPPRTLSALIKTLS